MASELKERRATSDALDQVFKYISPGTNEGISFEVSRLTDDLFTTSFLGGGDISLFTPSGHRGTIKSQGGHGYVLDSNGGPPTTIPLGMSIDLNTGDAELNWTLPSAPAATATIKFDFIKTTRRPEGTNLLFTSDDPSDDAAYAVSLILI